MITTAARLLSWENGTDLVIEMPLPTDPATVWAKLVDGANAGAWFAPFTVTDDGAVSPEATVDAGGAGAGTVDAGDEEPTATIVFDLTETELEGEILSCEPEDHVLVELDDFGVLGLRLNAVAGAADGGAGATSDSRDESTVLVFTQTAADTESAHLLASDHGPMWDTHLRLFAHSLGFEFAEVDEDALTARYSALDVEEQR